ncbi:MAG: rod shape-determining protein, partial [Clostridiales bacterium]|nr:rod shape-determining protein [Clostridiales bacterium]
MTKESGTVFALDVGTRSVVGIVGEYEDGLFITKAVEVVCHAGRAMFDGQIHSIPDVTRVVAEVRRRLEERLAIRLDKVLIAAAGRSLLTRGARARRILDPEREIDAEFILGMEIEALQAAQQEIDDDLAQSGGEAPHVPPGAGDANPPPMPERRARYFCVGYSTTRRVLDGYPISNLVGHSGNQAELEILGTFLPRAVVDSLYTVMRQAGLSVAGLTLEPIAALGAVVPPDLRRLNIALVDIGAGTSDIAITRDGDVFAYAMVAVAGDEITERICEYYLTDFHTGEAIKLALSSDQSEIRFKNALGREVVCTQDEVYQVVLPELERLSKMISDEILAYNKKVPSAVFLVGGGCQVPGFEQIFSATLGIDEGRVAIRDRSALENIRCEFDALSGPDAITPFGIAVGVDGGGYGELMSVTLNGKKVRLLDIRRPTVADVISLTGIEPAKLSGRSGRALSFVLNGEPKTVRGESAVSAVITVNGRPAGLDTALNFGDEIRLTEARNGRDAKVYASDLAPGARVGTVYCDGRAFLIAPRLLINGAECALATEIKEEDRVLLNVDTTVARFTEEYMPETTSRGAAVNGVRVSPAYVLEPGDRLEFPQEAAPAAPEAESVPEPVSAVEPVASEPVFDAAASA